MFKTYRAKHAKRVVGLDILRSIAILMVMFIHGRNLLPDHVKYYYNKFFPDIIDGVSIFFVLSGFLIGGILLKILRNTSFTYKDLVNFWIRRWFRTAPNYFLIILFLIGYQMFVLNKTTLVTYKYFLFLQNFATPNPSFFPEGWSLTIEEWFYLLFPFLIFILNKILSNKQRSLIISTIVFLIVPLILRVIKFQMGIGIGEFGEEFRKILILRLDSLMYGIIGAYIYFKAPMYWAKYKYYFLVLSLLLLIVLASSKGDLYPPLIFNLESLISLFCLPFLTGLKTTKSNTLDSVFIFISIISYGMYLLNLSLVQWLFIPISHTLLEKIGVNIREMYWFNYFLFWFYTILGSVIIYKYYENPMTKLRDKIKIK